MPAAWTAPPARSRPLVQRRPRFGTAQVRHCPGSALPWSVPPKIKGIMRRTLLVTNDFPPRQGGIQSFLHELGVRRPGEDLTVYAPGWDGGAAFDAREPFEVVRHPTSLMIPTPGVTRRAVGIARRVSAQAVVFGAAAPLGLITPALRRQAGITRAIAITHGHEAGWAALPAARQLLHRIGEKVDVVTYLGEYFRVPIAGALAPAA